MPEPITLDPWLALHANIGELVKAWKAAHESTFGLHWKKMPPFSWIFPQVDFIRIQRLMDTVVQQCSSQASITLKLHAAAKTTKNLEAQSKYYEAMIPYMGTVAKAALGLKTIANLKQSKLQGVNIPVKDANPILLDYQATCQEVQSAGVMVQLAWSQISRQG